MQENRRKTLKIGSEGFGYFGETIVSLYVQMAFPDAEIMWENSPDCDLIVKSHWDERDPNWNNIPKPYIYFSGEAYPPVHNRCHSTWIEIVTTLNWESRNSIYCPYAAFSPYWTKNVRLYHHLERPNVLAYCHSNPVPIREKLFDIFVEKDQTKTCHALGQCYGSNPQTQRPVLEPSWRSRKLIETYAQYTFVMALENTKAPGYFTEKIMNAYAAGAIPIYWGDASVKKTFNPDSFIDVSDFSSLEDCVDYALSLPKDRIQWMMQQPIYAAQDQILNIHKYATELYDLKSLDLTGSSFYRNNLKTFLRLFNKPFFLQSLFHRKISIEKAKKTIVNVSQDSQPWTEAQLFLRTHRNAKDPIFAPREFLNFFPEICPYYLSSVLPIDHYSLIVFHKGLLEQIELSFTLEVIQNWTPVFANEVFVIYAKNPIISLPNHSKIHLPSLLEKVAAMQQVVSEGKKID